MTLIDVDGAAAARARSRWPRSRHRGEPPDGLDIGGIGRDRLSHPVRKGGPPRGRRGARHALAGWPHERTAMNGFGFVQLVARLERPSILQRAADASGQARCPPAAAASRRRDGPGALLIAGHPAITAELELQLGSAERLPRRTGREVRIHHDPLLRSKAGLRAGRAAMTAAKRQTLPDLPQAAVARNSRRSAHPLPRPRSRPVAQRRLRDPRPAGGPRGDRTQRRPATTADSVLP